MHPTSLSLDLQSKMDIIHEKHKRRTIKNVDHQNNLLKIIKDPLTKEVIYTYVKSSVVQMETSTIGILALPSVMKSPATRSDIRRRVTCVELYALYILADIFEEGKRSPHITYAISDHHFYEGISIYEHWVCTVHTKFYHTFLFVHSASSDSFFIFNLVI